MTILKIIFRSKYFPKWRKFSVNEGKIKVSRFVYMLLDGGRGYIDELVKIDYLIPQMILIGLHYSIHSGQIFVPMTSVESLMNHLPWQLNVLLNADIIRFRGRDGPLLGDGDLDRGVVAGLLLYLLHQHVNIICTVKTLMLPFASSAAWFVPPINDNAIKKTFFCGFPYPIR